MKQSYPQYDSYKDSGVTWLGKIPSDWKLENIRAVTTLKSNKNQPDLEVLSVYREYGVIVKSSRDDNHNVTSLDTSNYKVVEEGDLVVNKMKAWQGSMGVSQNHGIVSPSYITCSTNQKKIYPKFLHYLLRSKPFIGVYNSISYGVRVGQWDMHYEDFKKIDIAYPSIEKQKQIVSFLDDRFIEIDKAIAKKERLIELIKEQKAIAINNAVTKGLNPNALMKDSGIEWVGQIPKKCTIKKLKYVSYIRYGLGQPPRESLDGLPLIRATNVERGKVTERNLIFVDPNNIPKDRNAILKQEEIIVVRSGAYTGDSAIITKEYEGAVAGYDMVVTPKGIDSKFLSMALLSNYVLYNQIYLKRMRAAQPHLNREELGAIEIIVPTHDMQIDIANYCNEISNNAETTIESQQKQIAKLKKYKQILIANVVTGKIKVT